MSTTEPQPAAGPKAKVGIIGIVGDALKQDFFAAARKLVDIGYDGIETTEPLLQGDIAENAKRCRGLGLEPLTVGTVAHAVKTEFDAVLEKAKALGVGRISCWWGPAESREQVLEDAAAYNEAGKRAADAGLALCYHNHDHEYKTVFDGKSAFALLAENTDPAYVKFELDIAWAAMGEADPVAEVTRLADRIPALHVKDVLTTEERGKWTVVGTGVVPIQETVEVALAKGVPWVVVEQDKPRNITGFEIAQASYLNLKEMDVI